jgi:hypothetical protein
MALTIINWALKCPFITKNVFMIQSTCILDILSIKGNNMTLYQFLILLFLFLMVIAILLISRKDDKVIDLQERVAFLEEKINKTLESRKQFIELKSVNAVLDTLNNLYYEIGSDGNYVVDSEYTLNDVTEEWWAQLSGEDLAIVNRSIHKTNK